MDNNLWRRAAALACLGIAAACPARPVEREATPAPEPAPVAVGDYLRTTDAPSRTALEVASRTFTRPGGPTVTLVGVSHIGERRLYDEIQTLLAGQDVVLYESVKPSGTARPAGGDDEQRAEATTRSMKLLANVADAHRGARGANPASLDALVEFAAGRDPRMREWLSAARIDAWGGDVTYRVEADGSYVLASLGADGRPGGAGAGADLEVAGGAAGDGPALGRPEDGIQAELARALGLEFQLEAIDYGRPNFRSSDMSIDELERALAAKGIDFAVIEGSFAGTSLPGRIAVMFLRLVRAADVFLDGAIADGLKVVLIELLGDEAVLEQSLEQLGPGFGEVIIDQRNQIVIDDLEAITRDEPDVGSVAILYGAAHLPDLAERLGRLGYAPAGDEWHTAFEVDLSRSPMTEQDVRRLRTMIRGMMGGTGRTRR